MAGTRDPSSPICRTPFHPYVRNEFFFFSAGRLPPGPRGRGLHRRAHGDEGVRRIAARRASGGARRRHDHGRSAPHLHVSPQHARGVQRRDGHGRERMGQVCLFLFFSVFFKFFLRERMGQVCLFLSHTHTPHSPPHLFTLPILLLYISGDSSFESFWPCFLSRSPFFPHMPHSHSSYISFDAFFLREVCVFSAFSPPPSSLPFYLYLTGILCHRSFLFSPTLPHTPTFPVFPTFPFSTYICTSPTFVLICVFAEQVVAGVDR